MTRCWVLEKGGDRCVLTTDHPGAHMGGYHTFTSIPGTEEMARLIGSHCDQLEHALRDKIADLTAECGRLRAERDGLANAVGLFFKARDLYGEAPTDSTEEHHAAARVEEAVDSMLRAAAAIAHAACAPEVKE